MCHQVESPLTPTIIEIPEMIEVGEFEHMVDGQSDAVSFEGFDEVVVLCVEFVERLDECTDDVDPILFGRVVRQLVEVVDRPVDDGDGRIDNVVIHEIAPAFQVSPFPHAVVRVRSFEALFLLASCLFPAPLEALSIMAPLPSQADFLSNGQPGIAPGPPTGVFEGCSFFATEFGGPEICEPVRWWFRDVDEGSRTIWFERPPRRLDQRNPLQILQFGDVLSQPVECGDCGAILTEGQDPTGAILTREFLREFVEQGVRPFSVVHGKDECRSCLEVSVVHHVVVPTTRQKLV